MTINSDQINYLVLRYLSESGFDHAAFTLRNEMRNAEVLETAWAARVPTGHLIDSLQRALMFEECLAQIDENGCEREQPVVLETGLIPAESAKEPHRNQQNGTAVSAKRILDHDVAHAEKKGRTPPLTPPEGTNGSSDRQMVDSENEIVRTDPVTPGINTSIVLEGHTAGLDQCAWHPVHANVLATSSKDGTARIWTLPQKHGETSTSVILNCPASRPTDKSVTSISWSTNGNVLATGSYDGVIRIWTLAGSKQARDLTFHSGPIFALKWSRRGDHLLSAAADGLIGVWQAALGTLQQKWDLKSPVMDIEWISDALFLSTCRDGSLRMWQLSREAHAKQFEGHNSSVNVLKWNSNINLGATGADDHSVKVWRADSENPTQILKAHKAQVLAIEWAPKDHGDHRLLASAGKDGQVCIWDVVRGSLHHILQHDRPIFTLHFSPANLLVTGGEEGEVITWMAETGKVIASRAPSDLGMIYHTRFSNNGDRIAIACVNGGAILRLS